jgi:queuine tRNA-ribosyltransferase
MDLVEAVAAGLDMFDCVLPTRMGRHGIAYTDAGPVHLMRQEFALDTRPVDELTPSPASVFSRGAIRHLLKAGELLGGQLLALHNLAYYQRLMRRLQEAITDGKMQDFLTNMRANWKPE